MCQATCTDNTIVVQCVKPLDVLPLELCNSKCCCFPGSLHMVFNTFQVSISEPCCQQGPGDRPFHFATSQWNVLHISQYVNYEGVL